MTFEKCDIITLGNGKDYTISEVLNHNQSKYLYLIEVDENEELLDETKSVKVVTDGKGTYGVEEIKDPEELLDVQEMFLSMVNEDYVTE